VVEQMLAAAIFTAIKELKNELAQARPFAKSGPDRRIVHATSPQNRLRALSPLS